MKRLALLVSTLAILAPSGCATTEGSASGAGFYSDLYWYDTWYWGGSACCVDPPDMVGPPRPEHPIALPPGSSQPPRPSQPIANVPSRPVATPMARPAARGGGGRR
jgi:hypothetical protein